MKNGDEVVMVISLVNVLLYDDSLTPGRYTCQTRHSSVDLSGSRICPNYGSFWFDIRFYPYLFVFIG